MYDNLVLFIGTVIVNVFAFLFHFYMGRVLGPADYGTLGVLLSISYIMGIFLNTMQTSIAKYVAQFKANKQGGKIHYLIKRSIRKFFYASVCISLLFAIVSPYIANFLHIQTYLLLILIFLIFGTLLLPTVRGSLQGLQLFKTLGVNLSIEGITKFFGGVLFVAIGWGVGGATLAFSLSFLIPFLLGLIPLKVLWKREQTKFDTQEIYKYSLPVLCMLLALTLFFSIDVILVKHFFDEVQAGHYAALSILGKILFFGSISISQVLVPKVAELYEQGKAHKKVLHKSVGIIAALVIPAIVIYFVAPNLIINILFGAEYLDIAPYLGWFAVFMGIFCFIYITAFYNIAIHKTKFIWVLLLFNIAEVVGLYMYHQSILQVITVLVTLAALLGLYMALYTQWAKR